MSREDLERSLALHAERERRFRRNFRSKRRGDPRRAYWLARLVVEKRTRVRRERQLAALPITSVSDRGLAFIVSEEGLRLTPYNDSAGHATVGVGHLIHHGGVTGADQKKYAGFTRDDAMALLAEDLDRFERVVRDTFRGAKLRATPARFDACVSLAFNIGHEGFRTSTVAKRIRAGDLQGAADAFLLWNRPPELAPRRRRERALFLST